MAKGMMAEIYRPADGSDCTNGGISAKVTHAVLTGGGLPEIFAPRDDMPEFVLRGDLPDALDAKQRETNGYRANGHVYAVPKAILDAKEWPMFGGNFIYTSDSRFRAISEGPIAVHDRVERGE